MDQIKLTGIRTETRLGVHRWEQQVARPIIVDVVLDVDMQAAIQSDQLDDTLDYDALTQEIISFASQAQVHLIETLAAQLCDVILEKPKVHAVTLTLHKPGALEVGNVSMTLTRAR